MKRLIAEIPAELQDQLAEIICWQCDGAHSSGDKCEWRVQGTLCDVVEPAVELIHEAYWKYQLKELHHAE